MSGLEPDVEETLSVSWRTVQKPGCKRLDGLGENVSLPDAGSSHRRKRGQAGWGKCVRLMLAGARGGATSTANTGAAIPSTACVLEATTRLGPIGKTEVVALATFFSTLRASKSLILIQAPVFAKLTTIKRGERELTQIDALAGGSKPTQAWMENHKAAKKETARAS